MRSCFALALFALPCEASHVKGSTLINDLEHIQGLNSVQGSTWVAGHQDFFEGMTFDDSRVVLGTALSDISEHLNETLGEQFYTSVLDEDVPVAFDARRKWPGLIHPIRDQQRCGSCWAFSASEVLGDRVAIATKKASPVLSPEDLVSCDSSDMGCNGGMLSTAWSYLKHTGIVTDSCMPYTAGDGVASTCSTTCADSKKMVRTKARKAYAISGVANMQKDVMRHGPIQVAFMVYKSFMSYQSGVYQKHWYELLPEGGHAVKIIGWGTDAKLDYWLVANSWGPTWGEKGYFRIRRGKNSCGIETKGPPYAGLPAKASDDELILV